MPHPTINHEKIEDLAPLIQVYDMGASLKFYFKIGFVLAEPGRGDDDSNWVMLSINGSILMLNTMYERDKRPPERDAKRNEYHNDLTFYFSYPDVDSMYSYLTLNGIESTPPFITGYNWKAILLKDPDGYGVCFHWPA